MYPPGLRLLRKAREKLGLTYREVEKASYELALKRGRPDFILHLSRLADIENRGVVPSLHKLYSMATIYHVDPIKMASWCEAPLQQTFRTDCYSLRRKQIGARHGPHFKTGEHGLIDTDSRRVQDGDWQNEYERPLYFVELREGFRCGWFVKHSRG